MRSTDDDKTLNLSGAWRGVFSYPKRFDSVSFSATLAEKDSWLTGTTQEPRSQREERGLTITASLQGRRVGTSVTWLKLYDHAPHLHSVHYAGVVSNDGDEIHGHWEIPGSWSGAFLMIREGGAGVALTRRTAAVV